MSGLDIIEMRRYELDEMEEELTTLRAYKDEIEAQEPVAWCLWDTNRDRIHWFSYRREECVSYIKTALTTMRLEVRPLYTNKIGEKE